MNCQMQVLIKAQLGAQPTAVVRSGGRLFGSTSAHVSRGGVRSIPGFAPLS